MPDRAAHLLDDDGYLGERPGPDDGFAHPHHCQSGRDCFAAPAGAILLASDDPDGDRSRG
jgi:hypothetical protein